MSCNNAVFVELLDFLLSELAKNASISTTRTYIQCLGGITCVAFYYQQFTTTDAIFQKFTVHSIAQHGYVYSAHPFVCHTYGLSKWLNVSCNLYRASRPLY